MYADFVNGQNQKTIYIHAQDQNYVELDLDSKRILLTEAGVVRLIASLASAHQELKRINGSLETPERG